VRPPSRSWRAGTLTVLFAILTPVVPAGAQSPAQSPSSSAGAAGDPDGDRPLGVVMARDLALTTVVLGAAREVGGARWRGQTLDAPSDEAGEDAAAAVREAAAAVRRLYFEADFLGCLARLGAPEARVTSALDAGDREAASTLAVFGAGCALGAGDEASARRRLRWVGAAELDPGPLAEVAPELQALAEEVAAQAAGARPVALAVRSVPPDAAVVVDARDAGCRTPCERTLPAGPHRIELSRVGRAPRQVDVDGAALDEPAVLELALDPAPAELVRRQLRRLAEDGEALDAPPVLAAAAEGFGARVVAYAWRDQGRVFVAVYDRGLDRLVARASDPAAPVAGRAAVREWLGVVTPTPLRRDPLFWLSVVGAAAAVGVAVFFLTRPDEERFDVVVP